MCQFINHITFHVAVAQAGKDATYTTIVIVGIAVTGELCMSGNHFTINTTYFNFKYCKQYELCYILFCVF